MTTAVLPERQHKMVYRICTYKPGDWLYHAVFGICVYAETLKQVLSCELFPMEVMRTNVMSLVNMIGATRKKCKVKHLVGYPLELTFNILKPYRIPRKIIGLTSMCNMHGGYKLN